MTRPMSEEERERALRAATATVESYTAHDFGRTVSLARISLSGHDAAKPLRRWFDNYKDDKNAVLWSSYWAVVTRDGRRWKVETGAPESIVPSATYAVDLRAPAPPIFEFRPPPPEPVPPRFNVAPPPRMPSATEYIMYSLTYSEQQELRQRIRDRPPPAPQPVRPPPAPTRRNQ